MRNVEHPSDFGADRYKYDAGECSCQNGWAQLDTAQDASYFGTWISLTKRQILSYTEGDVALTAVDTDEELVAEVQAIHDWNEKQGHKLSHYVIGIDPGFDRAFRARLVAVGLGKFLH